MDKAKVFLVCTGVGHINRGFESFTTECFAELKNSEEIDLYLLKGAGKSQQKEISIACLKRNSKFTTFLSKITGKEGYWLEQATFLISMLPKLIRHKPKVIYYSDFTLGTFLWHLRRFLKFKYKLLFSNGAPNGPPFKTEDHVQQLLPMYITQAELGGEPLDKLTLLPYATNINKQISLDKISKAITLREKFDLPVDKKIIISVGAVNAYHKRMDYVVKEFAKLNQDEFFLLVLGQLYAESESITQLAEQILKKGSYLFKQVNIEEVQNYMALSDYFVLASLSEGLPRVLPEALSNGLLPIVHDYNVTRQTLKDYGVFGNLTKEGMLAAGINEVDKKGISRQDIVDYSWQNYSWEVLKAQYIDMIKKLLN